MSADTYELRVQDKEGEDIPPGAIMRVTALSRKTDGEHYYEVKKMAIPPESSGELLLAVNSLATITNVTEFAKAQWVNGDHWLAYDDSDGTPAFGEMWGVKDDDWKLRKDEPGFMILGQPDTDNGFVYARFMREIDFYATLDGALSAATDRFTDPATASATIVYPNLAGNLEESSVSVTVTNRWEDFSLSADKLMRIRWSWRYLEWEPYVSDCP